MPAQLPTKPDFETLYRLTLFAEHVVGEIVALGNQPNDATVSVIAHCILDIQEAIDSLQQCVNENLYVLEEDTSDDTTES